MVRFSVASCKLFEMGNAAGLAKMLRIRRWMPRGLCWRARGAFIGLNNALVGLRKRPAPRRSGLRPLDEIEERARIPTDISDHLVTIFTESLGAWPLLVVELGVRGGESTFVFERVAELTGARLVSVDIDAGAAGRDGENTFFVRSDDVEFAQRFQTWCGEAGIDPLVDVLFVDTSHSYDHTVREIAAWFPYLSRRAKVLFHDTNLGEVYWRRDGSLGTAWDNERGVVRAIEEYFGTSFDEERDFADVRDGWLIKHHASCNGLTVLERIPSSGVNPRGAA